MMAEAESYGSTEKLKLSYKASELARYEFVDKECKELITLGNVIED